MHMSSAERPTRVRAIQSLGAAPAGRCSASARRRSAQAGFSLIEVSIVTAIILLIAVVGIPAIGNYVLENKVPKVGQELARFVMHMRINAGTSSGTPYGGIGIDNLAAQVVDSSVLTKTSTGTVLHGLGTDGTIEVAAEDSGNGFVLRLKKVNHAACPSIASVLQRLADSITVGSGQGAGATVKNASTPYSALATEAACAKGDVNQFEFHVT